MTGSEASTSTSAADGVNSRAAHAFSLVAGWLLSEPMAELLAAFGEQLPGPGWRGHGARNASDWLDRGEELPKWLDSLLEQDGADVPGLTAEQVDVLRRALEIERLAAGDFNFRTREGGEYRERSQADEADFDDVLRDRILRLTDRLGLVSGTKPRFDRYAKTLIMGGGYRSPLLRTRYAAQLEVEGIDLGEFGFLGSPRFLLEEPSERPMTDAYAPGAVDEFDLMCAAARAELGFGSAKVEFLCGCTSAEAVCPRWPYADTDEAARTPPAYTHERRVNLVDKTGRLRGSALSASTSRPPYRPNTADTFVLWARCADPRPGQRVLVVTTQVFAPFQKFDGIRRLYLGYGVEVDVVGLGPEWGDRPQTAEYLLQETLSTIRSCRRLLVDAAGQLVRNAAQA